MKNIVVSAAALRSSGALTIYRQFIERLRKYIGDNRYFVFVDPEMPQPAIDGVEYIHIDIRGNVRRVRFDWFGFAAALKRRSIRPDLIVSLQNTGVRYPERIPQVIYYHQSIPFYPHRWNPLKKAERTLFFYSRVYPFFVKASLTPRTHVVVQIPFIKRNFIGYFGVPEDRVHVLFPEVEAVDVARIDDYPFEPGLQHFLYPATGVSYKEHRTLVGALKVLRETDLGEFRKIRLHFTLAPGEATELEAEIRRAGLEQHVVFEGCVPHAQLLAMYKSACGLLFPSTIETLGLPLLEAAAFGLPVLASDLDYAHEVMGDYTGTEFIPVRDCQQWAQSILNVCRERQKYPPLKSADSKSWLEFFALIGRLA